MGEPVTGKNAEGRFNKNFWIVDTRDEKAYKKGHLPHSVNLMAEGSFETWLGSIIPPHERFYLAASSKKRLEDIIGRTAVIGYESQVEEAFMLDYGEVTEDKVDVDRFRQHTNAYTIIDVRNTLEAAGKIIFENSISIPLGELRESVSKIPLDKPIVVHCASGYRSAAGSSILRSLLPGTTKVFDLGTEVKNFM